eukprot:GHUV01014507.1.p3 GENE.GHUV01014507.1~~GHUV01014507.1.p3  ORF type:complete len:104 (-),score=8.39 GHUV01014507.1:3101-3412(-)
MQLGQKCHRALTVHSQTLIVRLSEAYASVTRNIQHMQTELFKACCESNKYCPDVTSMTIAMRIAADKSGQQIPYVAAAAVTNLTRSPSLGKHVAEANSDAMIC